MKKNSSGKTVTGKLKVVKIGGSLCIRITNMTKYLNLTEGDWVFCQIEKVEDEEE